MIDVPVLIAGGGPIGLTLGHELALHGVPFLLVERNETTTRHPKMDITNSRSMELFGRMGLSDRIRAQGVSPGNNFDVAWVTSMSGQELHRFRYPSQNEMWALIRARNDGSMPAEPALRISQIVVEPVLKSALEGKPGADVRFGCAFEAFAQDEGGVTCTIRDKAGRVETVRAQYLVGCDGGNSTVRRALGIELDGQSAVRSSYTIHFRSRAHDVLQRWGIAWHYQAGRGTLVAQDDDQNWTIHLRVPDGADPATIDPRAMVTSLLGTDIDPEILVANPWFAHLLVARRYRDRRVFLAGDSAHQFVPTGGYGMNTGVADAVDLGWKLAAILQHWGGPALLDSYEAERRPVALRNCAAAGENMQIRFKIGALYAAAGELETGSADSEVRRRQLASQIAEIGNAENERWGIEYGYIYSDSPIGSVEPGAPPAFDPLHYRPTTWPGARLPHIFLDDGSSLYSNLGKAFTLLVLGNAAIGNVEEVASEIRMPLKVLRLPPIRRDVYERDLILVRPDHHVCWRADTPPSDWRAVLDLGRGARPSY